MGLLGVAMLSTASAVHVYWARGGQRGSAAAVPEVHGKPVFTPGAAATFTVAGALAIAALTTLIAVLQSGAEHRANWPRLGSAVLALVFGARAVGNFRTVGFSKKLKGTRFATLDTYVYSPICAVIAGCCAAAAK
ncbi:hypothetical protein AYO38_09020 [bacterium SCGC AG-212-C10]|nr:hypothetical protein AYO38_09020 [bacterium SCGC AG-212-C10]